MASSLIQFRSLDDLVILLIDLLIMAYRPNAKPVVFPSLEMNFTWGIAKARSGIVSSLVLFRILIGQGLCRL